MSTLHVRRAAASAALSIMVALSIAAAPAAAKTELIDFDDLPPDTEVLEQYSARGIHFGYEYDKWGKRFLPGRRGPLTKQSAFYKETPHSGVNGLYVYCPCAEFPDRTVSARLDYASKSVSVWTYAGATLRAFDAGANLLATAERPHQEGWKEMRIDRQKRDIVFVELEAGMALLDDLSFEAPDDPSTAPPPDFAVRADTSSFFGAPALLEGSTANVPIVFTRVNKSSAPIQLGVQNLPAGVTGSFDPNPAPGNGSMLRLAASNGVAAAENRTVTVTATGEGLVRTASFKLNVIRDYDARITGIDVLQAVQREETICHAFSRNTMTPVTIDQQRKDCRELASLPPRDEANLAAPMKYSGVELVRHSRTVVRVFANTQPGSESPPQLVELRGYRGGKQLKGGPLLPEEGGRVLAPGSPVVTYVQRADPTGAFTFTLPDGWTKKSGLTLKATLLRQSAIAAPHNECETQQCILNNTMTLESIPFVNTGELWLGTARLWVKGEKLSPGMRLGYYLPDPDGDVDDGDLDPRRWPLPRDVFSFLEAVTPLADGNLRFDRNNWFATLDVSDVVKKYPKDGDDRKYEVRSRLDDYADDHAGCAGKELCGDIVIGVYGGEISTGGTMYGTMHNDFWDPVGVAAWERPDSVAHEVMHGWGRDHSHAVESCGTQTENTQLGDNLDGSGWGFVQGVGLDRRFPDIPGNGRYQTIGAVDLGGPRIGVYGTALDTNPMYVFDNMSYCRPGRDVRGSWTHPEAWRRNLQWLRTQNGISGTASAKAAGLRRLSQAARTLRVLAVARPDGPVLIEAVKPGRGSAAPAGGEWSLRALAGDGTVLAEAPLAAISVADEPGELALKGEVAAPAGAVRVAVVRKGAVVAERAASTAAPSVRITSPKRRDVVGLGRSVTVKWVAADSDGDELRAKVDYSIDGGRVWRPLTLEPSRSQVSLPSAMFAADRRARVRVRVNDGFHEATAVSAPFRAVGRPPSVDVLSPAAGQEVPSSAHLYLSGSARDDRGRALRGKRLRWFDGRRRIGRGERISVAGLRPGKRRIRLVARDRRSRRATASVSVRVLAETPRFLTLDVPAAVPARRRAVRLRVATTVPAVLRIGRQRFEVGRRARKVRVRLPRRRGSTQLLLQLSSGGKRLRTPVVIARR